MKLKKIIVLLNDELNILKSVAEKNKIVELILKTQTEINERVIITADAQQCREAGDALVDLLAEIGFDIDYSLTSEGRIIDDLIDKFFIK